MPIRRRELPALAAAAAALLIPGVAQAVPPLAPAAVPPTPPVSPLPREFLWGVSCSGFQAEGHAPDSNWTRYIASGAAVDELRDSVDFHTRYAADIDLAAELGARVFRMSVEWARVQPQPQGWDEAALGFYDNLVARIIEAGMRPMITLDHWVYPGWAWDRGGWRNQGMVEDWLVNARKVVNRYAARDPLWVTFNEPAAYIGTELRIGGISGGEAPAMLDRIAQAHSAIYDTIHRCQPTAMVTSNIGYVAGAEVQVNQELVDRIGPKIDFVGVDYYFAQRSPDDPATQGGADGPPIWELPVQPQGIYYALRHYSRLFPDRPLFVVENGMATENGKPRPDGYTRSDHLRDTLYWIQCAVADGMKIIGYNYWSLTDNYEWGSYTPRFGLYTVDVLNDPTLARNPTDAVAAYTRLIADGGVSADYRPVRPALDCAVLDSADICAETEPQP
ncbi:glycoside hydrolase family 1 protein [Nocardia panacis]|uniref:beta-glucosidase n=1 Tax=Nocardia panacis TaxID=2340916 RepID=A0A3A4JZ78_9NOCA|nr:family 1 glycosylhydrolase [Nocardia panacis]RJO76695.1 glycoside hydrolase family 1 protein [Nocardia panacis]